jgi:hypothetical protein
VPVLFGDDQTHTDSLYTFRFNNLMKYWIEKQGHMWYKGKEFETRYSTVDEYLEELELEGYEYKVHTGDFHPLIEDVDSGNSKPHALDYWSGYYSNRPMFKTDIRNLLSSIKIQSKLIAFLAIQRLNIYSNMEL